MSGQVITLASSAAVGAVQAGVGSYRSPYERDMETTYMIAGMSATAEFASENVGSFIQPYIDINKYLPPQMRTPMLSAAGYVALNYLLQNDDASMIEQAIVQSGASYAVNMARMNMA